MFQLWPLTLQRRVARPSRAYHFRPPSVTTRHVAAVRSRSAEDPPLSRRSVVLSRRPPSSRHRHPAGQAKLDEAVPQGSARRRRLSFCCLCFWWKENISAVFLFKLCTIIPARAYQAEWYLAAYVPSHTIKRVKNVLCVCLPGGSSRWCWIVCCYLCYVGVGREVRFMSH